MEVDHLRRALVRAAFRAAAERPLAPLVGIALRAAAARPFAPLVRTALLAAAEREAALRRLAALLACRESARREAARRGSCFSTRLTARETRGRRRGLRRP
jgi:hypothetical protein